MIRRFGLFGVCIVSSVCIILLIASHQLANYSQRLQPDFSRRLDVLDYPEFRDNLGQANVTIKDVIELQRLVVQQRMEKYHWPDGQELSDYMLDAGGRPLQNIIVTTWRSGSTFLGEVLHSVPGTYYHYEPLLDYDIQRIREPPLSVGALANLRNLLHCNYTGLTHYLDYGRDHVYLFLHNEALWEQCQLYPQYCWNSVFLNQYCSLFPFQTMKTVRLRLSLAEELILDKSLNVRVLFLVRDPRGTMQSRKHRQWCPGHPDCDRASVLCSDMVADYTSAVKMSKSYPHRFRVLRYEDFSMDPHKGVEELFDFFGLFVHPNVREFLNTHTKINIGGVSSTFRDSKSTPFHWKYDLDFSEVRYIEEQCMDAMHKWGYVRAHNESSLKDLNTLMDYTLSGDPV